MGIVFRQSIKSSIVIVLGALLGAILNYIYPFALTKAEFGFYTNIIYTGAILQIIATIGTGSLLAVFIQKYPANDARRKALIGLSILLTIGGTIILTGILSIFKSKIVNGYHPNDRHLVDQYFYWLPALILLWALMSLLEHYLLSQTKVAKSAFIKEVLLRLLNFILISVLFYKLINFNHFIILSILVHCVPVLVMYYVSKRTEGFGLSFNFKVFSRSEYKEIIHFSWYHVLLGVSLNVMGFIDTLMLGRYDPAGMEAIAPYRIAVMVITLMTLPYRAMSTASYATLNQAYIDNDIVKVKDLFSRSGINILVVATGIFIITICNLDNLISLCNFPPGYDIIKPIIVILLIGRLFDMATGLNNELISISKYYKFNFRVAILLLIMVVVFDYILIPKYSVYGAAWGATASLIIFNIIKVIYLWVKMRLQPFNSKTGLIIIAGATAGIIGYVIPFVENDLIDLIIRTGVIFVIYLTLLLVFRASDDLTTYLKSVKNTRRLF